jgi:hypothetical protein
MTTNAKGDGSITIPSDYLAKHWNGEADLVVPITLSAWTDTDKNGNKFQSIQFEIKGEWKKRGDQPARSRDEDQAEDEDDSIPY